MDSLTQTILKFTHLLTLTTFIILPFSGFAMVHPLLMLGKTRNTVVHNPDNLEDFTTSYYKQTLDHFNYRPESYSKFNQKYVMYAKHWGGASHTAPIFVYFGDESPLYPEYSFVTDIAHEFRALVILIEHRFYGDSIPFGLNMEEVVKNASIRGYFNSAQALADYAEVILYVKKKLHAHHSPVVVFGGSYGGMLAAWFRLKYPHVAVGALASSAPILYFDHITPQDGYFSVITKVFRETSESCYETIRDSWAEIEKVASQLNGHSILQKKFKICSKLHKVSTLTSFLTTQYELAAQYGQPPVYATTVICNAIDGARKTDILERIYAGMVAYYGTTTSCYEIYDGDDDGSETTPGWHWQTCSEMVMPMEPGPNSTMFQPSPFNWREYSTSCVKKFNVAPRPHWITTLYGGQDIKSTLKRFGSNIIFSNGLRDPYSAAGVLENISDTIVAIKTEKGSHCMDINQPDATTDPEWLVNQRNEEVKIIKEWIKQYYEDLAS